MFRDVHREGRFAHGGASGDDDHFGFVQAVGHFVEFIEAGREAGDAAAPLVQVLNGADGGHHVLLHRLSAFLEALFGDFENGGLHLVQEAGDIVLLFVRAAGELGADADDFAQRMLFLEDLQVMARIRRRREEGEKLGDEGGTTDLLEQAAVVERLRERHDIDRFLRIPHLEQEAEDCGQRGRVEVLRPDGAFGAQNADLARSEEKGTDDALLRIAAGGEHPMPIGRVIGPGSEVRLSIGTGLFLSTGFGGNFCGHFEREPPWPRIPERKSPFPSFERNGTLVEHARTLVSSSPAVFGDR